MRRLLLIPVVVSFALATLAAEDWPQFRGSQAGVGVDHPDLPDSWSTTENVRWRADVPGLGWSSPIVSGDHVFITSVVNSETQEVPKPGFYLGDWAASKAPHRWMVYDLDFATGKVRWERKVSDAPPAQAKHLKNT